MKAKYFPLVCCIILLSSCAATVSKRALSFPETERSTVYIYGLNLDTSDIYIDGVYQDVFDMGVITAPGIVEGTLNFHISNDNGCMYDDAYCFQQLYNGDCAFSVDAEPGRTYGVKIIGTGSGAFVRVEDEKSGEVSGLGNCEVTDEGIVWGSNY